MSFHLNNKLTSYKPYIIYKSVQLLQIESIRIIYKKVLFYSRLCFFFWERRSYWNRFNNSFNHSVILSFYTDIKTLCLSCRFATLLETGLLLYNGRYNERHDFIALELVEGGHGVQFSFSLGSVVTRVVARSARGVNDGRWHTVTVNYFNKVTTYICQVFSNI